MGLLGARVLLPWALHSPGKSLLQGSVALSSKYNFRFAALSILTWKIQLLWPWACQGGAPRDHEDALWDKADILLLLRGREAVLAKWAEWVLILALCAVIPPIMGFPGGSAGKESACDAGDLGLIPGLGRCPEKQTATHSNILT